jgi:hypothetical protein
MPSTKSSSMPKVWDSSTVMTPSLPTLSIASAMILPISGSLLAEMAGDLGDLVLGLDVARLVRDLLDDALDGLVDAALEQHRVGAGGDVAQAFLDDGLGQDGRGGGAVTGDVVGLGGDLLGELGAHVLVGVLELDLAGDGHAVLGDRGGAPLLVDDDVAALGAERHLDGVGELVDALLEATAGVLAETEDLRHVVFLLGSVAGGQDEVLLAADLDLGAAVLAERCRPR